MINIAALARLTGGSGRTWGPGGLFEQAVQSKIDLQDAKARGLAGGSGGGRLSKGTGYEKGGAVNAAERRMMGAGMAPAMTDGEIDGPRGRDAVPMWGEEGEYVLPKEAVAAMGGTDALDKLVETITGKAPGGKPVERDNSVFEQDAQSRMMSLDNGAGMDEAAMGYAGGGVLRYDGGVLDTRMDGVADTRMDGVLRNPVLGYEDGGEVEKKTAADLLVGQTGVPTSSTGVPVPPSGSYAQQRAYARMTGAQNIPAPVKPPPLPSSNTLAPGSAAHSRSLLAERTAEVQSRPIMEPRVADARPQQNRRTAPDVATSSSRAARSDYSPQESAAARLAGRGYQMRDVAGAKGVTRLTGQDGRTIYTNDLAGTSEWMRGGMAPGVNTVGGGQEANDRLARANAIRAQTIASGVQDKVNFNAGGALGRMTTQKERENFVEPAASRYSPERERAQSRVESGLRELGSRNLDPARERALRTMIEGSQRQVDTIAGRAEAQNARSADQSAARAERMAAERMAGQDPRMEQMRRMNALEDRIVNQTSEQDAADAAKALRAINNKAEAQDKFTTFYDEVPLDAERPAMGSRRVPFVMSERTGQSRPAIQGKTSSSQLPPGITTDMLMSSARHYLSLGADPAAVNARLAAFGLPPVIEED